MKREFIRLRISLLIKTELMSDGSSFSFNWQEVLSYLLFSLNIKIQNMAAKYCALKFVICFSRLLGLSNLSVWPSLQVAWNWRTVFPLCVCTYIYISEWFSWAVFPLTGKRAGKAAALTLGTGLWSSEVPERSTGLKTPAQRSRTSYWKLSVYIFVLLGCKSNKIIWPELQVTVESII